MSPVVERRQPYESSGIRDTAVTAAAYFFLAKILFIKLFYSSTSHRGQHSPSTTRGLAHVGHRSVVHRMNPP